MIPFYVFISMDGINSRKDIHKCINEIGFVFLVHMATYYLEAEVLTTDVRTFSQFTVVYIFM